MKKEIHPEVFPIVATCACGAQFKTRSTRKELHVDICSQCHPFYTGNEKIVDTEGRVERFTRRYNLQDKKQDKK